MTPQLAAIIARTLLDLLHAAQHPAADDQGAAVRTYFAYKTWVHDTYHVSPLAIYRAAHANGDI